MERVRVDFLWPEAELNEAAEVKEDLFNLFLCFISISFLSFELFIP